jgi:hypothetical protein
MVSGVRDPIIAGIGVEQRGVRRLQDGFELLVHLDLVVLLQAHEGNELPVGVMHAVRFHLLLDAREVL